MKQPGRLLTLLMGATLSLACINTTYSRLDEVEITDELVHLVLGQFAHHGTAFYEAELSRTDKLIEEAPDDFDARNDRGAALLKLKRYDEAETAFLANEEAYPGRYKTHSNLGVLYKKAQRYDEAAAAIERALEIKPAGHMGLGDYYLQMIRWLGKVEADNQKGQDTLGMDLPPEENFLGISYNLPPQVTAADQRVNREYLITLVKNDYKFPDVYVVLGDVLFTEGDYQMALRCYLRAANLGHLAASVTNQRTFLAESNMKAALPSDHVIEPQYEYVSQFNDEIAAAEAWLGEFQALEAARIAEGREADFKSTKEAMALLGKHKPTVIEIAAYKGKIIKQGNVGKSLAIAVVGLAIFTLVGFYLILKLAQFYERRRSAKHA